jgi:hypothetical protein
MIAYFRSNWRMDSLPGALSLGTLNRSEGGEMPEDRNPKIGRQRQPGAVEAARMMEDSIRQAFLTHMGEQQRQFAVIAVRRAGVRSTEQELAKKVRQQQHTGSHDKPEKETQGSDLRGGTRAGAENVEPKRR